MFVQYSHHCHQLSSTWKAGTHAHFTNTCLHRQRRASRVPRPCPRPCPRVTPSAPHAHILFSPLRLERWLQRSAAPHSALDLTCTGCLAHHHPSACGPTQRASRGPDTESPGPGGSPGWRRMGWRSSSGSRLACGRSGSPGSPGRASRAAAGRL